ncbi:MAG: low temperature requirement protein A [Pyrinomonadaceae bacterium]
MADESPTPQRRRVRQRLLTLDSDERERHASWLELFFDLVFVLAVSKVAAVLGRDSDLTAFLEFLVLFILVWWSWVGYTFYADRFESEEAEYRVLTFASMLAVVALSLTIGGAFSLSGDVQFVTCYAAVRLLLVAQYTRTAYYVPVGRSLAVQYIGGFGTAALVLLLSLLFAPPVRYYIWIGVILLELSTPFINTRLTRIIPFDRTHIPERFGLFTIIVLGEAVIATANGAAGVPWTFATAGTAALGFAMAACIWWINFDFVEDNAIKSDRLLSRFMYIQSHYFIVASIVIIGIGAEHAIKDAINGRVQLSTSVMLGGGVAAYLTAVTAVRIFSGVCTLINGRLISIAVAIATAVFGTMLPPYAVVAILLLALAAGVWFESLYVYEHEEEGEISPRLVPCQHESEATIFRPRSNEGCELCVKNNYKWVHLRMCLECGHVGCCDSSRNKHATKHYHSEGHPIMASLEDGDNWAWCYSDERFVPLTRPIGKYRPAKIELVETEES